MRHLRGLLHSGRGPRSEWIFDGELMHDGRRMLWNTLRHATPCMAERERTDYGTDLHVVWLKEHKSGEAVG